MRCPKCGHPAEPEPGRCLDQGQIARAGAFAHVRVITALVRHCSHCDYWEAGHDIDGVYIQDDQLIPMTWALGKVQDHERGKRQPRHEPGG